MLTRAEVKAIKKRLAGATPGRWCEGRVPGTVVSDTGEVPEQGALTREIIERYGGVPVASDVGQADREFLTHVKEDLRRLLEDREGLLERLLLLEERRWSGGGA